MLLSIFLWIDTFEGKQPRCPVMAATLKQSPSHTPPHSVPKLHAANINLHTRNSLATLSPAHFWPRQQLFTLNLALAFAIHALDKSYAISLANVGGPPLMTSNHR